MISPAEFAARLSAAAAEVPEAIEGIVMRVSGLMTQRARGYIGTLQPNWPSLADSTKTEKARLGYGGPPDFNPLLREGDLRDSYEPLVMGFTGGVVSTSKIAVYQEMGTSRIPPRPVSANALYESLPELNAECEAAAVKLLTFEA